jgi:hypothetical protein
VGWYIIHQDQSFCVDTHMETSPLPPDVFLNPSPASPSRFLPAEGGDWGGLPPAGQAVQVLRRGKHGGLCL